MILYVVFRWNKSVDFTLVFSLRFIFFRFLAGETAFLHTKTHGPALDSNHPFIKWAWEALFVFVGGGESSRGREDTHHHNPGVNNKWRLPLLPLTPSWSA